jgi:ribosomal protein S18 acetylase RimI-like enzyme
VVGMEFKYIILETGKISIFKKIDLNNANVKKYKSKNKGLSHIRTGKDYKGYIYIDKHDNVIGFVNMRVSDKYIQAIEVDKQYQGQGFGKKLLNELLNMGAERLSVNKKNVVAKKMYDKHFKVEDEDETMYYMVLKSIK